MSSRCDVGARFCERLEIHFFAQRATLSTDRQAVRFCFRG